MQREDKILLFLTILFALGLYTGGVMGGLFALLFGTTALILSAIDD